MSTPTQDLINTIVLEVLEACKDTEFHLWASATDSLGGKLAQLVCLVIPQFTCTSGLEMCQSHPPPSSMQPQGANQLQQTTRFRIDKTVVCLNLIPCSEKATMQFSVARITWNKRGSGCIEVLFMRETDFRWATNNQSVSRKKPIDRDWILFPKNNQIHFWIPPWLKSKMSCFQILHLLQRS